MSDRVREKLEQKKRRRAGVLSAGDLRGKKPQPSKVPGIERVRDLPHPGQMPANRRMAGSHASGDWPVQTTAPKPPAIGILFPALGGDEMQPEPVFGQYPKHFIRDVMPLMRCERREVLHVCSGSLKRGEGIRVDVRAAARPDVLADGRNLPFRDGSIAAVMLDPPYTAEYAKSLYGVEYPLPSHLLAEAARVVRPCGRIAFVHFMVPYPPPGCRFVRVFGLSTGCGYAMRAVTVFEKEQDLLPGVA